MILLTLVLTISDRFSFKTMAGNFAQKATVGFSAGNLQADELPGRSMELVCCLKSSLGAALQFRGTRTSFTLREPIRVHLHGLPAVKSAPSLPTVD
jgi:hypothetical protein